MHEVPLTAKIMPWLLMRWPPLHNYRRPYRPMCLQIIIYHQPPHWFLCTFYNVSGRKWSHCKHHCQYSCEYGPSDTKNPNWAKQFWWIAHNKTKIGCFDNIEEDCTSGSNNDRKLGQFFDTNKEEDEQDSDEDPSPLSQPVLFKEDKYD